MRFAALLGALLLMQSSAAAAELGFDPQFGDNGFADLGPIEAVLELEPTSDGKILTLGVQGETPYVARYGADGDRDGTFGIDGIVSAEGAVPTSIAALPDGGFVTATGGDLKRYGPDGSVVSAFGTSGSANLGRSTKLVAAGPSGTILAAGTTSQSFGCTPRPGSLPWVARVLPDGTLDSSFGSDGFWGEVAGCDSGPLGTTVVEELATLQNGTIVLGESSGCGVCEYVGHAVDYVPADGADEAIRASMGTTRPAPFDFAFASDGLSVGTGVTATGPSPSGIAVRVLDGQDQSFTQEDLKLRPQESEAGNAAAFDSDGIATLFASLGSDDAALSYPAGLSKKPKVALIPDLSERDASVTYAEWTAQGFVVSYSSEGGTGVVRLQDVPPLRLDILKLKVPRTLNGVLGRGIYAKVKSNAEAVVKTEATVSRRTANRLGLRTRTIATGSGPVAPPRADQVPVFLTERAGDRLAANPGMKIRFRVTVRAKGARAASSSAFGRLATAE